MSDPLDEVFAGIDFPGKKPLRDIAVAKRQTGEPIDPHWDRNPFWKMLGEELTEFFAIGHLAAALGRQTVTIRSWENKGRLPLSKYRAQPPKGPQIPGKAVMGRRLYTRRQVEIVLAAAYQHGVMVNDGRGADWKRFARQVFEGWKTDA